MADGLGVGVALMLALMPASGPERSDAGEGVQCRPPAILPVPRAERPGSAREIRRMAIGGYTLALSWTPQYCAGKGRSGGLQCDRRIGRFGFILHGLWPEGKKGGSWPQYCAPAPVLSHKLLARHFCMTPSVQLMQHEWARHGTYMAKQPEEYFNRARSVYRRFAMPDMKKLARQEGLTAGGLAQAVARVNPGLRGDMVRVQASRSGHVSELWICLDTAFVPARCPAGKKGLPPSARIAIRTGY